MELLYILPNPTGFIHSEIARFSKAGSLDFHSTQSFATSSETILSYPNSCWLDIFDYFSSMLQEWCHKLKRFIY